MKTNWSLALKNELWELHEENPGWSTRKLAEEMGLPFGPVDNALYKLKCERKETWLQSARLGFFDIEAGDLNANVGYMLSWALLMPDDTVKSDVITKKEIFSGVMDKRIVRSALRAIQDIDVLVTFYGTGFDVPYLRARALVHGLPYPGYGQILHLDVFYMARRLLKLSNRRMGTAASFLGLEEKDFYDVSVWNKARLGDKEALGHILSHNEGDVRITKQLWMVLAPYIKGIRKSI